MSVLMPKDNLNVSKSSSNGRERSPRAKNSSKTQQQQQQIQHQSSRDSLKIVNEKNAANLTPTEADDDSESENLSPLLNNKSKHLHLKTSKMASNGVNGLASGATASLPVSTLHIDDAEAADDVDNDTADNREQVSALARPPDNSLALCFNDYSAYFVET